MSYAKIKSWEVENFMAYKYAKCEFDEKGVVVLKGYNDSGKSAMLQALNVLMFNKRANSQVGFIKDEEDYFRIKVQFEDGVEILRDKYKKGQSLYEMYKDGELIFTTKVGESYSKVSEVPEVISEYLGLVDVDGAILNSRSCIEKQLLVQTTGSENYKMLNTVLKSEELSKAINDVNSDKLKVGHDITYVEGKIESAKDLLGENRYLTEELVKRLEERDNYQTILGERGRRIYETIQTENSRRQLLESPKLKELDYREYKSLNELERKRVEERSLKVYPDMKSRELDVRELTLLKELGKNKEGYDKLESREALENVDIKVINILKTLREGFETLTNLETSIEEEASKVKEYESEKSKYMSELKEAGYNYISCPSCSHSFVSK